MYSASVTQGNDNVGPLSNHCFELLGVGRHSCQGCVELRLRGSSRGGMYILYIVCESRSGVVGRSSRGLDHVGKGCPDIVWLGKNMLGWGIGKAVTRGNYVGRWLTVV